MKLFKLNRAFALLQDVLQDIETEQDRLTGKQDDINKKAMLRESGEMTAAEEKRWDALQDKIDRLDEMAAGIGTALEYLEFYAEEVIR